MNSSPEVSCSSFVGVMGLSSPLAERFLARVTVPLASLEEPGLLPCLSSKDSWVAELLWENGIATCDGGPVGTELVCDC